MTQLELDLNVFMSKQSWSALEGSDLRALFLDFTSSVTAGLQAELEAARAANVKLRKAVQHYSEHWNWDTSYNVNGTQTAWHNRYNRAKDGWIVASAALRSLPDEGEKK
jgi:hypothetical protein